MDEATGVVKPHEIVGLTKRKPGSRAPNDGGVGTTKRPGLCSAIADEGSSIANEAGEICGTIMVPPNDTSFKEWVLFNSYNHPTSDLDQLPDLKKLAKGRPFLFVGDVNAHDSIWEWHGEGEGFVPDQRAVAVKKWIEEAGGCFHNTAKRGFYSRPVSKTNPDVVASKGLTITIPDLGPEIGSDHRGYIIDVEWPRQDATDPEELYTCKPGGSDDGNPDDSMGNDGSTDGDTGADDKRPRKKRRVGRGPSNHHKDAYTRAKTEKTFNFKKFDEVKFGLSFVKFMLAPIVAWMLSVCAVAGGAAATWNGLSTNSSRNHASTALLGE